MKPQDHDALMRCAFGDASPEEAMRIEASANRDPLARECLDSYREIRDGLRSLAHNIPEHQLSNDRLRQAILAKGLSTTGSISKAPWWTFAWMPVAAAGIAAAIFFMRPVASNPANLALSSESNPFRIERLDAPSGPVASRVGEQNPLDALGSDAVASLGSFRQSVTSVESRTGTPVGVGSRGGSRMRRLSTNGSEGVALAHRATEGALESPRAAFDAAPSMAVAGPAPSPMAESERTSPIILIDREPDTTGASRATEVASPSNVVIGG